jgi:hypothetical protein
MRTISHCKHTKLKHTKIYSKGALFNHTKISTNENFPLYGTPCACMEGNKRWISNCVTTVRAGCVLLMLEFSADYIKSHRVLPVTQRALLHSIDNIDYVHLIYYYRCS